MKRITYSELRRRFWYDPKTGKLCRRARISLDGKEKHLGLFSTPKLAHNAYVSAIKIYHGEFARAR